MGSTVRTPPDAACAALSPLPARESDRRAGVRWLEARLREGSGDPGNADARAIEKCLDLVEFERMLDPRRVHRYVARVADDPDEIVKRLWEVLRADEGRRPREEKEKGARERDGERMEERAAARRGVDTREEERERGNGNVPPPREEDRASLSGQSGESERPARGNGEAKGDPREDEHLAGGGKAGDKGTRIAPEFDLRHAILSRSKRTAAGNPAQPKADHAEEENADAESRSERPSRSDRHDRNERRSRSLSDRDDSRERRRRYRRRRRHRDDFDDSDREYRRYLRRRRRSRSRSRSYSPRRSPSEERDRELRREERRERRRIRELEREERRRQRKRRYAEEGPEGREGKEYDADQAVERERRERDDESEYRRARRKRRKRYEDRSGRDYDSDGDYESDDYRERRRHRRHRSRREYRDRDRDRDRHRDRDEDEERWHKRRYDSHDRPHPSKVDHAGGRDNGKDYGRRSFDSNRRDPHSDEVGENREEPRTERRPYDGPNARERPGGILRPGANGIYRPNPRGELRNEEERGNFHDRSRREDEAGLGRDVPWHPRREGMSYRDEMPRQGRDSDDHRDSSRTAKVRENSLRNDRDSAQAEKAEAGVSGERLEKKRSSLKLNELRSKVLASMGKKTSSQDLEAEK